MTVALTAAPKTSATHRPRNESCFCSSPSGVSDSALTMNDRGEELDHENDAAILDDQGREGRCRDPDRALGDADDKAERRRGADHLVAPVRRVNERVLDFEVAQGVDIAQHDERQCDDAEVARIEDLRQDRRGYKAQHALARHRAIGPGKPGKAANQKTHCLGTARNAGSLAERRARRPS